MGKVLQIILLAVVFSVAFVKTQTTEVNCWFIEVWGIYTCRIPNFHIDNDNENQNIEITGIHIPGRSNDDVVNVEIHDSRTTFVITQLMTSFVNMTGMQIFSSELNRIQLNAFGNAANLETLEITGNHLTSLGPMSFFGTRLTWLDLDNNRIDTIHVNAFAGLSTLRELNITRNRLQELHPNVFNPLTGLTIIRLDYNQLVRIQTQLFANNLPLIEISLGWNQINAVGPTFIDHLPVISTFRMPVNQCASISYIGFTPEFLRVNVRLGLAQCMANYEDTPVTLPPPTTPLPPPNGEIKNFLFQLRGSIRLHYENGTQILTV